MIRFAPAALCAALLAVAPALAAAQVPGLSTSKQFKLERLGEDHWRATGEVEMEKDDLRFFADIVDYFPEESRLIASGNVVFVSRDSRIAAERMEFNTRTRTGVFYKGSGTASLGEKVDKTLFGTQEPDAYFYGETLEKLGPKKYRITKGGFTTCVQPTPRWDIIASSATVTLDDYAILKNSVLRVKGVPMFYMPIFYYPINEEDRATGFLIPVYGSSTIRGQSLSNAFFWAIARNQDATVFHDWFSTSGQGVGGEYRYIAAPGSEGQMRTYWLAEKEAVYSNADGSQTVSPGRRSYEIRANAIQRLPLNMRARVNIDYFSDITTQQTYFGNLYDASRRQRVIGGNLAGTWGANSLSFTYNRNQVFFNDTDSTLTGNIPRVLYSRAARKIGSSPLYFSAGGEYARLLRTDEFGGIVNEQGLDRIDFGPSVRLPFSKLTYLSLNASAAWRGTMYSDSLENGLPVPTRLWRSYFDLRTDVVGPVFTKIWDTPDNGYATRYKHVIEPIFGVQKITSIDNFDEIIKLDSIDYIIGDSIRYSYGLTNRFIARRRVTRQAREFLNVTLSQTYYTDPRASQFDPTYGSSFSGLLPSNFSPVLLLVRALPTDEINGSVRLEYDYPNQALLSVRANGVYALRERVAVNGGWSQRRITALQTDNYMDMGAMVKTYGGRFGGAWNLSYDFFRDRTVQQRMTGYYHAQCCGVAVEYQVYNFPTLDPRFVVPQDRRFNISFTLAGVGTFSNFFGALGGNSTNQRRY